MRPGAPASPCGRRRGRPGRWRTPARAPAVRPHRRAHRGGRVLLLDVEVVGVEGQADGLGRQVGDHLEALGDGVDHAGLVAVQRLDPEAHATGGGVLGHGPRRPRLAHQAVPLPRPRPPGPPDRGVHRPRHDGRADGGRGVDATAQVVLGRADHVGSRATSRGPAASPRTRWRRGRGRRAGGRCGRDPSRRGSRRQLDHVEAPRGDARREHDDVGVGQRRDPDPGVGPEGRRCGHRTSGLPGGGGQDTPTPRQTGLDYCQFSGNPGISWHPQRA